MVVCVHVHEKKDIDEEEHVNEVEEHEENVDEEGGSWNSSGLERLGALLGLVLGRLGGILGAKSKPKRKYIRKSDFRSVKN